MPGPFIVRGDDGEEYGPVGLDELAVWVRENRAGLGTTVRTDQPDSTWQPWQHYPELVALLAEKQALGTLAGLVLAPLGPRMGALIIDLIFSFTLVMLIWSIINIAWTPEIMVRIYLSWYQDIPVELPQSYAFLADLVSFGIPSLYSAGFIAAHGKTPGKAIFRLRVVNAQGGKPALFQALVRGFFFGLSLGFYGLPFLVAFVSPQRRAIHDVAAGTYVVEA